MNSKAMPYARETHLYAVKERPAPIPVSEEKSVFSQIFRYFTEDAQLYVPVPDNYGDQRRLLRALLNIRDPRPVPAEILALLDRFLWTERLEAGIAETDKIPVIRDSPGSGRKSADTIALWQGDICRLDTDAIVNAANGKLLGCFQPLHSCIDNAIHSAAGPQLRADCDIIMKLQDCDEPPGQAKITRAYNLPSRFVIHTVGPIVNTELEQFHRVLLASCYRACLDLAADSGRIKTIAFCCISTGVYGFPAKEAVPIAVETVSAWLEQNPYTFEKVIFNVFTNSDYDLYKTYLKA
ncbi:protein-ADP-ribose hydrolase [Brucepastera parasyntrophica]|uniref:protein-ADP-ribose hydrolase n=1 Tax=Brucepastera parasyntrophica TaxID=2880008 RepID=UPI002109583E|nr:protein-ADP-ribose hydrolase [Brucepastera parasyntrophica]ULQ60978.1 protein-ADP-ribose hydrolase [Brucepastera parasyntrophica]